MSKKETSYRAPIYPDTSNFNSYQKYKAEWKFYLSVKSKLPEWWDEFNTDHDNSTGRVKWKSIRKFIATKVKHSLGRALLYEMIGPEPLDDNGEVIEPKKRRVPWLGDWKRARRNGFSSIEDKGKLEQIHNAIKENLDSSHQIKAIAPVLVAELTEYLRMGEQLNEAFGGQVFSKHHSGDHAKNKHRFSVYMSMKKEISERIFKTAQEIMRVHGVNPDEPNQMWNMANLAMMSGQVGAAAALTGAAAMQQGKLNGDQLQLSDTTLLFADHLQQHAMVFKRPLPKVLDAEIIVEEENTKKKEKTNGHSKAN